jgi:hypothetical protein
MIIIFGGFISFIIVIGYVMWWMLKGSVYMLFYLLVAIMFTAMGLTGTAVGLGRGIRAAYKTHSWYDFFREFWLGFVSVVTWRQNSRLPDNAKES